MHLNSNDLLPSVCNTPIRIGPGIIVGLLGTGGMAKVYKVWNEKLEIFRAVKILNPSNQNDYRKGFEIEAKITAKLNHPNIVNVYDIGEWNTCSYMEMEFVEGTTLAALISRYGKLPVEIVSSIAIQIASALTYAHNQEYMIYGNIYKGIIHRDLKPANIMISNKGELKLMDFGIARPKDDAFHTQEGLVVGTLQYLSPEQLKNAPLDHRTDIYSLGAIIYEMLTGIKTFPQPEISDLVKKKSTNKYNQLEEFKLVINHRLIEITNNCLKFNKEDRPHNVEVLLNNLIEFHNSISRNPPYTALKKFVTSSEARNIFTSFEKLKKYKKTNQNNNKFEISDTAVEHVTDDFESNNTRFFSEKSIDVYLDSQYMDNLNRADSGLRPYTCEVPNRQPDAISQECIKKNSYETSRASGKSLKKIQDDFENLNNKDLFSWPQLRSPVKNEHEENSESELFHTANTDDSLIPNCSIEAKLFFEIGLVELEEKRYSAALKHFKAAYELEPENKMYKTNLAQLINLLNT